MNPFLLTACISIALGVTATQAHASVPVDRGILPVARLPVLFGQDASEIPEAGNEGPVLQWYTDQALLTQSGYTAAVAAYRKATPIAVLRGETGCDGRHGPAGHLRRVIASCAGNLRT